VERGERGIGEDFAKCCDETFKTPGTFMRLWEHLQREAFPVRSVRIRVHHHSP